MASFEQLYQMQMGQTNPLLNVQQLSVDMPNWLRAPTPPSDNIPGTNLLLNQMNRVGDVQFREDKLEQERERARAMADIQMQTFQAKQAQIEQARQDRENLANIEGMTPQQQALSRAGYGEDVAAQMTRAPTAPMAIIGPDGKPVYVPRSEAVGQEPYKTPGVSVNLPGQMTEEQKIVGKAYGEDYVNLQRGGRQAYQENAKLNQLNTLLDDTYTGMGAEKVLAAKKAAQMLGMDVEGIGEAEAAQAITNELALQLRNPAGGAGMPGAMSDKDREFLQSMTPGLAMSAEGRKMLVDTKKKLNKRSIEVAKMARDYRKANGALDEMFFDELAAYSEENELFADEAADMGITVDQNALDAELRRRGLQ